MITLKNVSFSYDEKQALSNLSLTIRKNDYLMVLGRNGSGKSTFLKLLNGLLLPMAGDVRVENLSTRLHGEEIRQKVGMVFQNPDDQLVASIVREDIAFGLENLGVPLDEMQRRIAAILSKMGIAHLSEQNVNTLSYGQKQLVALCGVLVMQPSCIVFDEPTTMLDPLNRKNVMDMIIRLHTEGNTIVHATNDPREARRGATAALILDRGRAGFHGHAGKVTPSLLRRFGLNA